MNRNATILLTVCLLTGCATTPPPTAYETWRSRLTEGQELTLCAAVLAAEVFNETYDHTNKELADPNVVASLRDKINEARKLFRRAQSWNQSKMPAPPEQPTDRAECSFPNHWVLLAPGLPVKIDYAYAGPVYERGFFALKIVTLRGKSVMSWTNGTAPEWYKPFESFVTGDSVEFDIQNLIRRIKIDRE